MQRQFKSRFLGVFCVWIICFCSISPTLAAPPTQQRRGPSLRGMAMPIVVSPNLAGKIHGHTSKLDSALQQLATVSTTHPEQIQAEAAAHGLRIVNQWIQVELVTDAALQSAVIRRVEEFGGTVTGFSADGSLIQAWLMPAMLKTAAADPNILAVRRPAELIPTAQVTEVLPVILGPGAPNPWHLEGYKGKGIKVAIIDAGFMNYQALLGTELPSTVNVIVKSFTDLVDGQGNPVAETPAQINTTVTSHGTACAEVVFDIAPEATIYLVKVGTPIDVQEAVAWMKLQKINVVSASLGVGATISAPGDGTGMLSDIIRDATNHGMLWVNSAGNEGLSHWNGTSDAKITLDFDTGDGQLFPQDFQLFVPNDPDSAINWIVDPADPTQARFIGASTQLAVEMKWDDWASPSEDYDLLLVRYGEDSNGDPYAEVMDASTEIQDGQPGQWPIEFLNLAVTADTEGYYGVVIRHVQVSGKTSDFDLIVRSQVLEIRMAQRSMLTLGTAPAALTVAAVMPTAPFLQAPYSAEGPTNGPGGTGVNLLMHTSAVMPALKPNIAAYAHVSTATLGPGGFGGTSAAAPHVAGAAALVMDLHSTWTVTQTRDYLESTAVDMGPPGVDHMYGHGRLQLGSPYVYFNDFEGAATWLVNPKGVDTALGVGAGQWEQADPAVSQISGHIMQFGTTASGAKCLVTAAASGLTANNNDVDGGVTTIHSPAIQLPAKEKLTLSLKYSLGYSPTTANYDSLVMRVIAKGFAGQPGQTYTFYNGGAINAFGDAGWKPLSIDISSFAGKTVYIELTATDNGTDNVFEAQVDDVKITIQP